MLRTGLGMVFLILCGLVLGEILVSRYLGSPRSIHTDSIFGWLYESQSHFIYSLEGYGRHSVNAEGFLDEEWAADKSSILIMGDSFVEGLQVDSSENLVSLLRRSHPRETFAAIARSGFGPAHYAVALQKYYRRLNAKFAIVFINESDFADLDAPEVKWTQNSRGELIDVALEPKPLAWWKGWVNPILNRSALANFIYQKYSARLSHFPWEENGFDARRELEGDELAEKIKKFRFVLNQMKRRWNIHFVYEPHIRLLAGGIAVPAFPARHEILQNLLREADSHFLSLLPIYQQKFSGGLVAHGFSNCELGEGHWNRIGHQLAATMIEEEILQ